MYNAGFTLVNVDKGVENIDGQLCIEASSIVQHIVANDEGYFRKIWNLFS
ncbi:hypothetical protein ACFOHW_08755 [Paenibacillus abyssi]|uniref:Uncharacterized protein n=1 Tax=Paenibacillus abyssi TaxID=1340531 RepID=A0A917CNZ5_9BACL|nr:hypothetical protein GCM10010916_08700 [Paenibacillus abyssi]